MHIGSLFQVILALFILSVTIRPTQSSSISKIVDLKTKINKLVLKESANGVDLYVASTNHLYKLSDNDSDLLKIEIDLSTGPKAQKQQCAFVIESPETQCIKYICDDEQSRLSLLKSSSQSRDAKQSAMIDYENRLLLIDTVNNNLIECATTDNGGCRLRNLDDLQITGCNYSAPVIPFSSASGVVINKPGDSSLYLMVSNEYDPTERLDKSDFPVFSIRYLTPFLPSSFQSKYPIESMNYDQTIFDSDFHMKIVYSFKHNGFVYFLFTITNKMLSESCNRVDADLNNQTMSKIVTRMLRICDNKWSQTLNNRSNRESSETFEQIANLYSNSATNLATLTETVVDCEDKVTGIKYSMLQSAYFHPQSNQRPAHDDDSILFMTFNSSSSSNVCKVTIKEIDKHFVSMLNNCLEGDNNYAELVSPYSNKNTWKTPCRCSIINDSNRKSRVSSSDSSSTDRKLFCHNDIFNYINSRKLLTIRSIEIQDQMPTTKSFTSLVTLNHSTDSLVLILATSDARIVMLRYDIRNNRAQEYDQIELATTYNPASISSAFSINLAVHENNSTRSLYVTYGRYLYKINLQHCAMFDTCESCVEKKRANPFCGWCVYEQRCLLRNQCSESIPKNGSLWLIQSDICPQITQIHPTRYLNPIGSHKQELYTFKLNLYTVNRFNYFCDIANVSRVPALNVGPNSLQCDLASAKSQLGAKMRVKPIIKKFMNMTLSIRAGLDGANTKTIASTNIFTFNCSHFIDCSQCLSEQLANSCIWCASSAKCVFARPNELDEMQCGSNEKYQFNSTNQCTSLANEKEQRFEIAYSADSSLTHFIRNRYTFQSSLLCLFSENKSTHSDQKILTSELALAKNNLNAASEFTCHISPYLHLSENEALKRIYVSLWWSSKATKNFDLSDWHQISPGGLSNLQKTDTELKNDGFIEINVINCKVKASSCGKCLEQQIVDLGCGWCQTISKCTLRKDCPASSFNQIHWVNDVDSYCPNPAISRMTPKCGPKSNAGTRIILEGENLGNTKGDIRVKMKPINSRTQNDDLNCQIVEYTKSAKISCETKPIANTSENFNEEFSVYVETNILNPSKMHSSFNQSNQFIYKYVVSIEIHFLSSFSSFFHFNALLIQRHPRWIRLNRAKESNQVAQLSK
jgi:hypothetical protein